MSASFDNLSLLDDDDTISFLDGRQTMSDGDGGAVLRNSVECSLDDSFATDIDGTCSFVKDENLGFSDDGSCDGNALALAARKLSAAVTDNSIISLRGWSAMDFEKRIDEGTPASGNLSMNSSANASLQASLTSSSFASSGSFSHSDPIRPWATFL